LTIDEYHDRYFAPPVEIGERFAADFEALFGRPPLRQAVVESEAVPPGVVLAVQDGRVVGAVVNVGKE
jgi:hypothetical protein